MVEDKNGTIYKKNRQHLKKTTEPPSQSDVMSQPDIPSIPITSVGQVDNSLESTPSVSDTDHQRPQRDRRPPAYLRAVLHNFQLSSIGREKMKFVKLSQMNGLDK